MIFNWYGADFTGNGKDQDLLLKFIAKYVPHKVAHHQSFAPFI